MVSKDLVIVEDGTGVAGRVVYWRLEGTMEHEVLSEAWLDAELDEKLLPSPPTPERALKRSLKSWASKRVLVRPLGVGVRGYALVSETAAGKDLSHATELRVVLEEEDGKPKLELDPPGHPLGEEVLRRFAEATMELDTRDASTWLGTLVFAVHAVSLRDKGGVYFIPRTELETWDRFVAVLGDVSEHRVFQLPAMKTADAVEAILDAITTEAKSVAERIEEDLGNAELELGKRALRTRISQCEATLEKVGRYEDLLDRRLDDVRDRIGSLRAQVATAILMADTDDEKGG